MQTFFGILIFIIIILGVIGAAAAKGQIERGETKTKVLVRKYKTTASMEREMNRLNRLGWEVAEHTAAAGFFTGTRSYTVVYKYRG